MRKFLITTGALAGVIAATAFIGNAVKAQPYHGGMMGGYGGDYGYGPGYGMMGGYLPSYGRMMGNCGCGHMMGPGYGYGRRGYDAEDSYRGKRLCWNQNGTNRDRGYYAPCQN